MAVLLPVDGRQGLLTTSCPTYCDLQQGRNRSVRVMMAVLLPVDGRQGLLTTSCPTYCNL